MEKNIKKTGLFLLLLTAALYGPTIFNGFVASDGDIMAYETLTAQRLLMFMVCVLTNDYSWQTVSLALEKELGYFWEKDVLIKYGVPFAPAFLVSYSILIYFVVKGISFF